MKSSSRTVLLAAGLAGVLRISVGAPVSAVGAAGGVATTGHSLARVVLPPANVPFDYQLGGAYAPAPGVGIVDRDRTAKPAPGKYNVCYVNGFQTQSHETRWWKLKHPDLLLRNKNGSLVIDGAWDEVLLDPSTPAKRSRLMKIVGPWIDGCSRSGFDAVEVDNLDSYSRSSGRLSRSAAVAFATLLADRAHRVGLAFAQKNDSSMVGLRRQIGFDFAIVEECQVYSECDAFTKAYGSRVYEIEYVDAGGLANFRRACNARGARISITYRDRDVVPRGNPAYVSRFC